MAHSRLYAVKAGDPAHTIPGSDPKTTPILSSFANVTMETFDQGIRRPTDWLKGMHELP